MSELLCGKGIQHAPPIACLPALDALGLLIDRNPDAAAAVDLSSREWVRTNSAFRRLLILPHCRQLLERWSFDPDAWDGDECWIDTPAGIARRLMLSRSAIRAEDGAVRGVLIVVKELGSDGTDRRSAAGEVRPLAGPPADHAHDRLEYALAGGAAAAWELDLAEGRFHRSANAAEVLGVHPSDISPDSPYTDLLLPDDRTPVLQAFRRLLNEGRHFRVEYRIRRKDGGVTWICDQGRLVDDGPHKRIAGIMMDITDRKRMEEALTISEERLRLAVEAADLGTWDWFVNADRLVVSERAKAIAGLPADAPVSVECLWSRIHPGDLPRARAALERLRRAPGPEKLDCKLRLTRPDDTTVWIRVHGRSLPSRDGRHVVRLIGTVADISLRTQAEIRLLEGEAQFRQLADSMPQIVWSARGDGVTDYCNLRWYTYTGTRPQPEGTMIDWLAHVHPDDAEPIRDAWRRAFESGTALEYELRLRNQADDTWRWHLARCNPVLGASGRIVRWYGTFTDIHEHKNAESALCALLAEKDNLLGRAAMLMREVDHRVKNSLGLISSLLLLQASQCADAATRTQLMEANTRVLTVAQVHQRLYQTTRRDRVDVSSYLEGLCSDLARSLSSSSRSLVIQVTAGPVELPTDDIVSLALIVNELVTNSAKYAHPDGGATTVSVSLESSSDGLVLTVADDGVGFPPGFDPRRSGSLGMNILIALTEGFDGHLDVLDTARGAAVRITLPQGHDP